MIIIRNSFLCTTDTKEIFASIRSEYSLLTTKNFLSKRFHLIQILVVFKDYKNLFFLKKKQAVSSGLNFTQNYGFFL